MSVSELDRLEAESIYIMREVAAELERPVLLFSGGKDSLVLLQLAIKAFRPGAGPFPVLHVDTGHNFPEVIEFRDRLIEGIGEQLIDRGRPLRRRVRRRPPRRGARPREGARVLVPRRVRPVGSARPAAGGVEPLQRPRPAGEHVRVFPLSSWTELDVWHYIQREELDLPSIYLAHDRRVFERDGMLLAESEWLEPGDGEEVFETKVRYRTVGDMTVTGAVRSEATELEDVIAEIATTTVSERGETRADDRVSSAAMEDRKREGYF
jgi:sulfate adenylyltransferase subunit 2